jgi:hypothetical protein
MTDQTEKPTENRFRSVFALLITLPFASAIGAIVTIAPVAKVALKKGKGKLQSR